MRKRPWEELVEDATNFFVYLFTLLIVTLPPLAWLSDVFSGKKGTLWVLASIIVFVFILPLVFELLTHRLGELVDRLRKGEVLRPVFVPLRALSTVLGIYGVFKLEYFLVHEKTATEAKDWAELIWKFLTTL